MPLFFDRMQRHLHQATGVRVKSVFAPPTQSEGANGDMRMHNGVLYIKDGNIWYRFPSTTAQTVTKLIDETGGTVSQTLSDAAGGTYPTDEEFANALASLSAKINEIIVLLQLNVKSV